MERERESEKDRLGQQQKQRMIDREKRTGEMLGDDDGDGDSDGENWLDGCGCFPPAALPPPTPTRRLPETHTRHYTRH